MKSFYSMTMRIRSVIIRFLPQPVCFCLYFNYTQHSRCFPLLNYPQNKSTSMIGLRPADYNSNG